MNRTVVFNCVSSRPRHCSLYSKKGASSGTVRIVSWNIRAGGGTRVQGIVAQLVAWGPDVVALSEFRDTPPSREIAALLVEAGLTYQRMTVDRRSAAVNSVLVAARWPLRVVNLRRGPDEPRRWLHVNVEAERLFALMAVHVPNRVTGRKYPFLDAVSAVAKGWRGGAALIVGDTNSGRRGLDEESPAFNKREDEWVMGLGLRGWPDVFRERYPERRKYTWYSPNGGNGFRLDQAFLNRGMRSRLGEVRYEWGRVGGSERRDALSDHAAMLLDFD